MLWTFDTWLRKLLIMGVMITLIAPTAMINDGKTNPRQQVLFELDEGEVVLPSNHNHTNNSIAGACPCPYYSSIVNMTNNNGSWVEALGLKEGTGDIWQEDYPIDNSWIRFDGEPSGAIWDDIPASIQEGEDKALDVANGEFFAVGLPGADLWTKADESYDFFISDKNGTQDKFGQYLTIETYHGDDTDYDAVGGNIDAVYLLFEDGEKVYASSVVLYELGTYEGADGNPIVAQNNGEVQDVLGPTDGHFTYMGNYWSKMVLCFGEYEDGGCQNDPYLPPDKDPGPVGCPCPQYDSIVNITGGPNNASIDRFFATEGTSSNAVGPHHTYETSIPTWWVGMQPPVWPSSDIFVDIPDSLQRDESCDAVSGSDWIHNTWSENYSGADLLTKSKEAYDFYISDASGNADLYGQFITIEVSHCAETSPAGVGGNIDSAWIQLKDGTEIFPSKVVYYEVGDNISTNPGDGNVEEVLGTPDNSFTKMGNNWSKIVLCFAEYWNGDCTGVGQTNSPFSQHHCDCPKYESLMGMENLAGATIKSIGIREYTRDTAYDVTYDIGSNFFGPSVNNAQNVHGSIGSYNLGNVPQWSPTSNIFIDTDDTAENLLASTFIMSWNENWFTVVDDAGVGVGFDSPQVLSHGASVGGATWVYDLHTMEREVYDFYVSDDLGNLDENGQFLAIEVNHFPDTVLPSVGGHIDSVWIELTDGTMVYGKSIVYFQPGTYQSFSGYSNTVSGDGSEATGPPDGVYTSMGNGYSKLVVCFGIDDAGQEIPLKLSLGNDSELGQKSDSEHKSILSGEVEMSNVTDMIIGFSVGAIGAIILLKKKNG